MHISGRGPARWSFIPSCGTGAARIIHHSCIGLLIGTVWFSCWAGETQNWRLIDFSADSGLSVFSDQDARLSAFRSGDYVADGQWRIESIAADHVLLEPVSVTPRRSSIHVLLRAGEEVPEPLRNVDGYFSSAERQGNDVTTLTVRPIDTRPLDTHVQADRFDPVMDEYCVVDHRLSSLAASTWLQEITNI